MKKRKTALESRSASVHIKAENFFGKNTILGKSSKKNSIVGIYEESERSDSDEEE